MMLEDFRREIAGELEKAAHNTAVQNGLSRTPDAFASGVAHGFLKGKQIVEDFGKQDDEKQEAAA
jgi:hypothetical protein